MSPKLNLYSAWLDPYFHVWAILFAVALLAMVYSIRRYLELKNAVGFEGTGEAETEKSFIEAEQARVRVLTAEQPELPVTRLEPQAQPGPAAAESGPVSAPAGDPQGLTRAENFVRGIYAGISDLDGRMKRIEAALSRNHINNDFTVKFLEDILQDVDSLDKVKIKARIEYLLSDLKKQ